VVAENANSFDFLNLMSGWHLLGTTFLVREIFRLPLLHMFTSLWKIWEK